MWLIIRESDNAIIGTNYNVAPSVPAGHKVIEWTGAEPAVHDPDEGIFSYDPTLADPDYVTFLESRTVFDDLEAQADAEIAWLEAAIPTIDTADIAALRVVLKRVAQENLREIRAWRYLFRRLG